MNRHRVTVSAKSFDIERLVTVSAKTGEPQWTKIAYYRTREGLLAGLRLRGLSERLAERVPRLHIDAIEGLLAFTEPRKPRRPGAAEGDDES